MLHKLGGAVGVRKVRQMREGHQPGIPVGEGLHTVKPFTPEAGTGRTHSAVKLLT